MYRCNCGRSFDKEKSLWSHGGFCDHYETRKQKIEERHLIGTHLCKCGKTFSSSGSLGSHGRFCNLHEKVNKRTKYLQVDGTYKCECGRSFEKSQSINAHFSRCLIHRNGTQPTKRGGGSGWAKGMTKETHSGVAKMAASLSKSLKGKKGKPHTEETKLRLSLKRIEFLENNPNNNIAWYTVSNGKSLIKVQGKWELDVANWLNALGISWSRHKVKYDGHRHYTPDFWLPELGFYLEVKGWLSDRDIAKMKKVVDETEIDLRLLTKEMYHRLGSLTLDDLVKFDHRNTK
jgi:hypothetical protein